MQITVDIRRDVILEGYSFKDDKSIFVNIQLKFNDEMLNHRSIFFDPDMNKVKDWVRKKFIEFLKEI